MWTTRTALSLAHLTFFLDFGSFTQHLQWLFYLYQIYKYLADILKTLWKMTLQPFCYFCKYFVIDSKMKKKKIFTIFSAVLWIKYNIFNAESLKINFWYNIFMQHQHHWSVCHLSLALLISFFIYEVTQF